jgi:ribulose-5-phosphate 4-epimerase/fuculose-1-phosphate aldolase
MPPHASETASAEKSTAPPAERDVPEAAMKGKQMSFPRPPTFETKQAEQKYLKERLALAFRIFGKLGYDEGVAGHITLRDPVEPTSFWVNPFGVAFSLMRASDLIRVNAAGDIVEGGEVRLLNTAAYAIHHAIHTARPDVLCAAHSHSIHGRAFSALGRGIDMITQDSCAFYNDLAVYDSFNGIVLDSAEGEAIATALQGQKAAILQNHGLLTVGGTIEAAVFWFVSLEKCCRVQLLVDAALQVRGGERKKIHEEDAKYTYKTVGTPGAGWFSALPMFDVMERESKGEHAL